MFSNNLKTECGIEIDGPKVCKPKIFKDERGFFLESWNEKVFNEICNLKISFVQDNHSHSKQGVIRGLHLQLNPYSQGKLIRCIKGEIFDVAVDLRHK